jgi:excisionase family DNA binding protein
MNSMATSGATDRERPDKGGTPRTAYSVQETAEQLGVCPASVYRALKRGELEAVTLGGRRLIPARSIDKLLSASAA